MKKLLLLFVGILLLTSCQKEPKTAFVKTETIFKEYKGIKKQEEVFKQQQEAFSKKYDSMVKEWQKEVMDFQQKLPKMSPKKAQKKDQELYQKQQIIQQMQQEESARLTAEMQQKTDSIIDLVYEFFNKYGKQNGYKYIYGKNSSGALMYGDAQSDITDAVLKALNEAFEAEQK
jgi:outer membrane protein